MKLNCGKTHRRGRISCIYSPWGCQKTRASFAAVEGWLSPNGRHPEKGLISPGPVHSARGINRLIVPLRGMGSCSGACGMPRYGPAHIKVRTIYRRFNSNKKGNLSTSYSVRLVGDPSAPGTVELEIPETSASSRIQGSALATLRPREIISDNHGGWMIWLTDYLPGNLSDQFSVTNPSRQGLHSNGVLTRPSMRGWWFRGAGRWPKGRAR